MNANLRGTRLHNVGRSGIRPRFQNVTRSTYHASFWTISTPVARFPFPFFFFCLALSLCSLFLSECCIDCPSHRSPSYGKPSLSMPSTNSAGAKDPKTSTSSRLSPSSYPHIAVSFNRTPLTILRDQIAGTISMVYPCGIIAAWDEM